MHSINDWKVYIFSRNWFNWISHTFLTQVWQVKEKCSSLSQQLVKCPLSFVHSSSRGAAQSMRLEWKIKEFTCSLINMQATPFFSAMSVGGSQINSLSQQKTSFSDRNMSKVLFSSLYYCDVPLQSQKVLLCLEVWPFLLMIQLLLRYTSTISILWWPSENLISYPGYRVQWFYQWFYNCLFCFENNPHSFRALVFSFQNESVL